MTHTMMCEQRLGQSSQQVIKDKQMTNQVLKQGS